LLPTSSRGVSHGREMLSPGGKVGDGRGNDGAASREATPRKAAMARRRRGGTQRWHRGRQRCRGMRWEIGQPDGTISNFHCELGFCVSGLLPFIPRDYLYRLA
jgi:hypothetical protein